ncbi:MAG: type II toxin-antitoxin system VapB family antitoxin [Pseudomonadota bacterium]|nr:type II toxin-antitoxin system VapB family antitoxin [Pseudomonadota bacterium]
MTLHIRNRETDELARKLAERQNISITDAVRRALTNELQRLNEAVPLPDRNCGPARPRSRLPGHGARRRQSIL